MRAPTWLSTAAECGLARWMVLWKEDSPLDHGYDPDFMISIEQQMTTISSLPLGQFQLFSEEEVDEVVRSLKVNKAAVPDT